ncbi:MarR family winged helix-turn-helix transcriptional regulator [Streptacidiphilus sp. P02-A3a]|uniref:MarR family winged helix-turn-helix transcriptional regulator n=1 Tax=Streptacidiphilus sp. P02-A3a TaxID=2704468 RepID=UPI0015F8144D|nr:MarR family transcriptional regulator [Streptacidiphilus sp. P02-A3a]QMU67781.1 MarR family transcriptional regulator [Streptacidiphilus sp. P02-A3a]
MGSQGSAGVDDRELVTWWGLVVEAYERTGRLVAVGPVAGVDLPGPWFEVLLRLLRTPGQRLTMTQLARETTLTSGGFTKLADRMVRTGLIERQSSPEDRRVTHVLLTAEGRRVGEEAQRRHVALLREHFLGPLGEERAGRVAELMRALRDANTPPPGQ